MNRRASIFLLQGLVLGAFATQPHAFAEQAAPPHPSVKQSDIDANKMQLRSIQDTLQAADAQRHKIEAEVEGLRADRVRLTAALLDTAAKVRNAEAVSNADQARLDGLNTQEGALRRSLNARRDVLAEVLAALQRMGRNPPPAVLVRPEDMLAAIRTSILLGAVLPQMRAQAEALVHDLGMLVALRASIQHEHDSLQKDVTRLDSERLRLDALVKARQNSQAQSEQALTAEQARARKLAAEAKNLEDLINRMQSNVQAAQEAASNARKSDEALRAKAAAEAADVTAKAAVALRDPARLAPAATFVSIKGSLPLPVEGTLAKKYGESDAFGSAEQGLSVATHPNAGVIAPCDAWVLYSGPYRSYGQLLILNAGQGYYIVLAGLAQINVSVGQFVLQGEPVGKMGEGKTRTAATLAIGASDPILYIEFRKDGVAIDPGPWWAKSTIQKVRG